MIDLDYATPTPRQPLRLVLRTLWEACRADAMLLLATLWIGLPIGAGVLLAGRSNRDEQPNVLSLYVLLAGGAIVWTTIRGHSGGRPLKLWNRVVCGVVAAVCLAGVIHLQSCPHATYLRVGPFLFPIAGRPCNNTQPFEIF